MLPGELFKPFHSERLDLVQAIIGYTPAYRFQNFPIQLGEVNGEQGSLHMELDSKRPVAEKEVKGDLVEQVAGKAQSTE